MKRNSFLFALRRTIPVLIGFFPLGIAYGILMEKAGFSFLFSGLTSLIVYAGSLQMIMIPFLAGSAPILTVVLTALLLNSRHIFYGLSCLDRWKDYGAGKWFLIYGLTDESYSLVCSYTPTEGVDEKWVHIFDTALIWFYWVAFSVIGGLLGSYITWNTAGLDFALTALFVVILIDQCRGKQTWPPILISLFSCILSLLIFGREDFLLPALLLAAGGLLILRSRTEARHDA